MIVIAGATWAIVAGGYLMFLAGAASTGRTNRCACCGTPINEGTQPDGYDDPHCRRCTREIEQRQDWLSTTATPLGGSN